MAACKKTLPPPLPSGVVFVEIDTEGLDTVADLICYLRQSFGLRAKRLGVSLAEALLMDLSFSAFYMAYTFVFTWGYDGLFPPAGARAET